MADTVYFSGAVRVLDVCMGSPELTVRGTPDRTILRVDGATIDTLSIPAEYADLLATALLRQQVPCLLRREGLNPDTPWQVLADYLRDQNTETSVREATLLQLAFAETSDDHAD